LVMGNRKALGHTRALQWFGLDIARPVVSDQEIPRASTHPAGPVEEQNSGHTSLFTVAPAQSLPGAPI
jgi:hypothetical protein